MKKNVSLVEFKKKISQIIREEITNFSLAKEEVNPALLKVKDKNEMAAWVMRQYFDPTKHTAKPWYDTNVSEDNVLDYVSQLDSSFPLTPVELADLWYIKKHLNKLDLKKLGIDEKDAASEAEQDVKKYQKGEETFDVLSKKFGLTKQAMKNIVTVAGEKVKHLTKGVSPWELSEDDMEDLFDYILELREDIADKFAKNLKAAKGNIEKFTTNLVVDRLVTVGNVNEIDQNELDAYVILAEKSENDIKHILMTDIEQDDNLFELYQFAISKSAFPEKRGRKKEAE